MDRVLRNLTPDFHKNVKVSSARSFSSDSDIGKFSADNNKSLIFKEQLLKRILSTPVDHPLSSSSCSNDSSGSFLSVENTPSPTNQTMPDFGDILRCTTPPSALGPKNMTIKNPIYARIQKDLNSPSATSRCRALRALKSPSKLDNYLMFDVPHEEQDIITAEERLSPVKKTIQDIMKDVVVYVEVRSGSDNRSEGIKDHLAKLGAKVNDKFYKDTTHVIFKDGILSTYLKAKRMGIPIVSILWIEACKQHKILMNPEKYKISNSERYEKPDLYKKIRRAKSMQPNSANNNGSKKKAKPAAVASPLSPPTKLPVLHRKNQNAFEQILADFEAEILNTPDQDDDDELLAGPMRLIEKMRNSPLIRNSQDKTKKVAPISKLASTDPVSDKVDNKAQRKICSEAIRKSLFNEKEDKETQRLTRARRRTMVIPQISNTISEESEIVVEQPKIHTRRKTLGVSRASKSTEMNVVSASKTIRRRSTIYTPKQMESSANESAIAADTPENKNTNRRETVFTPQVMAIEENLKEKQLPCITRRRTLFTPNATIVTETPKETVSTPDQAPKTVSKRRTLFTPSLYQCPDDGKENTDPTPPPTACRKSSIFTPKPLQDDFESTPPNSKRATDNNTPATIIKTKNKTLLDEYQNTITFSSTRTPISDRRKTVYDISMEIIDQRLSQINKISKLNTSINGDNESVDGNMGSDSSQKSNSEVPNSPSVHLRQTSMDKFYKKRASSAERQNAIGASIDTTVTKKRKLFAQPIFNTTLNEISDEDLETECIVVENKKRKTSPSATVTRKTPARRSSMLFASPKINSQFVFTQQNQEQTPKLATTNMYKEQIEFVKENTEKDCNENETIKSTDDAPILCTEPVKTDVRVKKLVIQDVMKDVVVYVEVRSGEDDRSEGIKSHIATLGAKVNDKLYKDTTHVIFKDGLLSTYQKAKKMGVPIVSILWIESCKQYLKLVETEKYQISSLNRYEFPDLYKKIRREKPMQPHEDKNMSRPPLCLNTSILSDSTFHFKEDQLQKIISDATKKVFNEEKRKDQSAELQKKRLYQAPVIKSALTPVKQIKFTRPCAPVTKPAPSAKELQLRRTPTPKKVFNADNARKSLYAPSSNSEPSKSSQSPVKKKLCIPVSSPAKTKPIASRRTMGPAISVTAEDPTKKIINAPRRSERKSVDAKQTSTSALSTSSLTRQTQIGHFFKKFTSTTKKN